MISNKVFKPIYLSAVAVVAEETKKSMSPKNCTCKRSELPIYLDADATAKTQDHFTPQPSAIEETIRSVRKQIALTYDQLDGLRSRGEQIYYTGVAHTQQTVEFLRQEDNTLPRYGAIAIGGLTGFIFGLRGRFLKRTFYSLLGAGGVASVCYPDKAGEYAKQGIAEAKKYSTIAYNFAYGVKKGESIHELPKLPTSFSEVLDMAKNFGKKSSNNDLPVTGKLPGDDKAEIPK